MAGAYTLEISFTGNDDIVGVVIDGDTYFSGDDSLTFYFPDDKEVTIQAITSIEKVRFCKWEGDVEGFTNPLTFTLDKDMNLTADYVFFGPCLITQTIGEGSLELKPFYYASDDVIKIKAVPVDGWLFVEWRGDLSGSNSTGLISYGDYNITAVFMREPPIALNIVLFAIMMICIVIATIIIYKKKRG